MTNYVPGLIKGGIVGGVAGLVGAIFVPFLPAIAPYAGIVGGAVTLVLCDMVYKG